MAKQNPNYKKDGTGKCILGFLYEQMLKKERQIFVPEQSPLFNLKVSPGPPDDVDWDWLEE